jgi:hypothetical protein
MGDENMPRKIKDNFKQVWCQRLITYAEKNHSKHASILSKMEQAIDSGTLEEGRVRWPRRDTASYKNTCCKHYFVQCISSNFV